MAGGRERYQRGAHTILDLKYQFVWKTKYGYKILSGDRGLRARVVSREICAEHERTVVKGNVRPDHLHVLVSAPSHLSPAKTAQFLKGKNFLSIAKGFSRVEKEVLGTAFMGSWLFLFDGWSRD